MVVSNRRKFIFIHNPKVAGTAFRQSIAGYHDFTRTFWGEAECSYLGVRVDLAHMRPWEMFLVAPNLFRKLDEYRKLVFVRNPMRRFVSACYEHFKKYRPNLEFSKQTHDVQKEMILNLLPQIDHKTVVSDIQFVHFSLQTWYIFWGDRRIADYVLPIQKQETFCSAYDILQIPRKTINDENVGMRKRYDAIACSEIDAFVRNFYKSDYEFFAKHDHLSPVLMP